MVIVLQFVDDTTIVGDLRRDTNFQSGRAIIWKVNRSGIWESKILIDDVWSNANEVNNDNMVVGGFNLNDSNISHAYISVNGGEAVDLNVFNELSEFDALTSVASISERMSGRTLISG